MNCGKPRKLLRNNPQLSYNSVTASCNRLCFATLIKLSLNEMNYRNERAISGHYLIVLVIYLSTHLMLVLG